jgi:3-hydroxyisobutyrate dehydrogenase-like beta-hydroxyacid dehydrogenase
LENNVILFASSVNFWHDETQLPRRMLMTTKIETVGIISPGDMGHVVGQVLRAHGLRVITSLQGRSARTQALADQAGIEDVGLLQNLVREADIVLSILVPAEAIPAAQQVARAIHKTGKALLYVDCNAIAPQTVRQIETIIMDAGGHFVDASIIGPPPRKPGATRFYASGPHAADFAVLRLFGLEIVQLGTESGQASAFKMCYAALTKGLTALGTELFVAAEALGVAQALDQELQQSQPVLYDLLKRQIPGMPPKARRWVGEMEEIAQTFAQIGLTPQILAGAADMYRFVGQTELANRTPEDQNSPPTLAQMVAQLANHLASLDVAT